MIKTRFLVLEFLYLAKLRFNVSSKWLTRVFCVSAEIVSFFFLIIFYSYSHTTIKLFIYNFFLNEYLIIVWILFLEFYFCLISIRSIQGLIFNVRGDKTICSIWKKDVLLVEPTNLGVSLILWPKLKSDSAGSWPKLVIPVESLNLQW